MLSSFYIFSETNLPLFKLRTKLTVSNGGENCFRHFLKHNVSVYILNFRPEAFKKGNGSQFL